MSPAARRAGLVALVLATLSPPRAHAVVCPAGEITLASSLLKAARKKSASAAHANGSKKGAPGEAPRAAKAPAPE